MSIRIGLVGLIALVTAVLASPPVASAVDADPCEQAKQYIANHPLGYERDYLRAQLEPNLSARVALASKLRLQFSSLQQRTPQCTHVITQLMLPDGTTVRRTDGKPVEIEIYIAAKAALATNTTMFEATRGTTELIHEIRWRAALDDKSTAGSAKDKEKAKQYIKWSQLDADGRYKVLLCVDPCVLPDQNNTSVAKVPTVPPAPQPATRPIAPPEPSGQAALKSPDYSLADLEAVKIVDKVVNEQNEELTGARLNFRKCPANRDVQTFKDLLEQTFTKDCAEITGLPNFKIVTVSRAFDAATRTLVVTAIAKWSGVPNLTSLEVNAVVQGTNKRPSPNCALNFSVESAGGGEHKDKLTRDFSSGILKADIAKPVKWEGAQIKLSPFPKADCRLLDPDAVYTPKLTPGPPGSGDVLVNSNGKVVLRVEVVSTKPDVTIILSTFLGSPNEGRAEGSLLHYPMKRDQFNDAVVVFLEEALNRYKTTANEIIIKGFDTNGTLVDIGRENGSDIGDPITRAKDYASRLKFSNRDYADTALPDVFDTAPKRNPRQLIVFGRSGIIGDYCKNYEVNSQPRPDVGDTVAVIDFAAAANDVANQNPIEGTSDYPAIDCRQPGRMHWVFLPENMSPTKGRVKQRELFGRFLAAAVQSSGARR
jgi:hypothetical protein